MIIKRKETWGELHYDTRVHRFLVKSNKSYYEDPYVSQPVLLNVDLTFKCNMNCLHCVAKDMATYIGGTEKGDLKITNEFIGNINKSPFMVVVITGGEPLLKECEDTLFQMVSGLQGKAIILDTNGTIFPSNKLLNLFRKRDVMVRVSWDIPHPKEEFNLRQYPEGMYKNHDLYIKAKEHLIKTFVKSGVMVAIQSVIHGQNYANKNFYKFPFKLRELMINQWYIQKFIPSHHKKSDSRYNLDIEDYEKAVSKIIRMTKISGINCFTKMDRRHNSVFLVVKDGELFTQSDNKPGEKIFLGHFNEIENFFEYVSSSEHSMRYYQI